MAQIIHKDTIWEGQINLTKDVQVADGATLTIKAGTKINGNGYEVETFGIVDFEGKRNKHISVNELDIGGEGKLKMNFVDMIGGGLMAPSGQAHDLTFQITNSQFSDFDDYIYAWYPSSNSKMAGNVLDNIPISSSGALSITDNVFKNYGAGSDIDFYDRGKLLTAWNNTVDFSDNVILKSTGILLEVKYSRSAIDGSGNYFDGTPLSKVHKLLWDNRDDLNAPSEIKVGPVEKPQVDMRRTH